MSNTNINEVRTLEESLPNETENKDKDIDDNFEMSINYANTDVSWYRDEVNLIEIFAYSVALEVIGEDDNDPQTIYECRHRDDWESWKEAIQAELNSLNKRGVFGPVAPTPEGVKPVGYKWVFIRKRNERNEIVRYKARLVAQGFSQKPGVDYLETYSPVVDATTLRFLVALTVVERFKM
ncbi:unnamed protein product [Rhodiola kirilowii]